ncbi:MAG: protein of unknown function transrane [Marmoricola sp.]|nr:protein of unknown function transrane [Marmoricola sp.]
MGPFYCLASAAGFGAMAIFAKLSYDQGVELDALLVLRFGLAGAVLLVLARARGELAGLDRRTVLVGLSMGAVGYAAQAGLYFAALTRVDASQVALVFCIYPLLVMVLAVVTRREQASRRRTVALGVAMAGIALVLSGARAGAFDPVGASLALGSALVYTCYILVGDRVAGHVAPVALAALVCTGAFGTFVVSTVLRGGVDLGFPAAGWGWIGLLVLVSTVGAILLFFAGLAQVGPSVAALLSIVEPVVTVVGAALVFGESLTPAQGAGGALVLAAVLVVQLPQRRPRGPGELSPPAATPVPVPVG